MEVTTSRLLFVRGVLRGVGLLVGHGAVDVERRGEIARVAEDYAVLEGVDEERAYKERTSDNVIPALLNLGDGEVDDAVLERKRNRKKHVRHQSPYEKLETKTMQMVPWAINAISLIDQYFHALYNNCQP